MGENKQTAELKRLLEETITKYQWWGIIQGYKGEYLVEISGEQVEKTVEETFDFVIEKLETMIEILEDNYFKGTTALTKDKEGLKMSKAFYKMYLGDVYQEKLVEIRVVGTLRMKAKVCMTKPENEMIGQVYDLFNECLGKHQILPEKEGTLTISDFISKDYDIRNKDIEIKVLSLDGKEVLVEAEYAEK